jgi:hypothetical protein
VRVLALPGPLIKECINNNPAAKQLVQQKMDARGANQPKKEKTN